jgi:hypothetical protein
VVSESLLLLANFTKLSRCSSSPGIIKMVSMGNRGIFPFMKCDKILDLIEVSLFAPTPSLSASGIGTTPPGATSIGVLLPGIQV